MAGNRSNTLRVHLSCSCGTPKAHYRYARDVDGLHRAVIAWINQGGHDNPNHRQRVRVESRRFVDDAEAQDRLVRRLANRPPPPRETRRPTAAERLARPGTVLRRYGA